MQREPHADIGRVVPAGTQGRSAAVAGTAQQHRLLLPIGIVRSAALLLRTTRRRRWRLSGAVAIIRLPSADA